MGPRPPTLPPRKFIFGLMVVVFWCQVTRVINPGVIHKTAGTIIYQITGRKTMMVLLAIMEVVLFLGTPTYPPKNIFLADIDMMMVLRHPVLRAKILTCLGNSLGMIN